VTEPLELPEKSLLKVVHSRGLSYGREDSFKLAPGRLLAGRFLIGIRAAGIAPQTFVDIAAAIGIPENLKSLFLEHLAEADVVLYGVEDGEGGAICKAYLEFWQKVRRAVVAGSREPALMNLGFKWYAHESARNVVARYTCYPMLDLAGMLRRIRDIYGNGVDAPSCGAALHLVQLAARRNAAPIYLEVSEAGTARRSFDINLYKADLTLADIEPVLLEAAARYAVADDRFAALYSGIRARPFGHISGGFARDGSDFLTAYYETQPL
jgi:hypothetical protein